MSKRKLTIIGLLLLTSLLWAGVVSADTIIGRGWIQAQGNGIARLKGDVHTLEISGNGSLWYLDRGEEDVPVVTGEGRRIEYANGWVHYVGFNGRFQLTDADAITVHLAGRNINLYAEGQGGVFLKGRGTYSFGNGDTISHGNWPVNGRSLGLK